MYIITTVFIVQIQFLEHGSHCGGRSGVPYKQGPTAWENFTFSAEI
jgi:hypothetical protein